MSLDVAQHAASSSWQNRGLSPGKATILSLTIMVLIGSGVARSDEKTAGDDAKGIARGGALAPQTSHCPARARRVIFLCMNGGPSHVDLFDYKPTLNKKSGVASTIGRERGGAKLLGSPFQFAQSNTKRQRGKSRRGCPSLTLRVTRSSVNLCRPALQATRRSLKY